MYDRHERDHVLGWSAPSRRVDAGTARRGILWQHEQQRVLLPLLGDDLPLGPPRAERLLDEHRRQRALLATLHAEACAHPELPTLAAKLAFLTRWLLADMAEEERCLLTEEVVRETIVVVDQASG
jgi:hypothetical protein